MNTVVINIDEAGRDLTGVILRLRERGGRVVLTDQGGPLAEITPVAQSDTAADDAMPANSATESAVEPQASDESRYVLSEVTGLWVVPAKPGQRMVTSEEIYEQLRGCGP